MVQYIATMSASADPLSATFSALADPTRRAILARLVDGEAPVTELAAPFEMSMPAGSKHLKVLEQGRPCRLAPAPLKEVADWVERYRQLWEERLDRLDDYLSELQLGASNDRAQEDRLERRDGSGGADGGGRGKDAGG